MTDLIKHAIPAPLEVFAPAVIAARDESLRLAGTIASVTAENVNGANKLLMGLHELEKQAEEQRKKIKGPVTQLGKAIDEVAERFTGPISAAKDSLRKKLVHYNSALEKERQEMARVAEQERQRQQKILDEQHAAEVKRLKEKAEAEAKEAAELFGTAPEPAKVVEPPKQVAVAPAPVIPAAPPSAVTMRKVTKLKITEPRKIAAAFAAGQFSDGFMVVAALSELRAALDAGVAVPGAELVVEEVAAVRGGA